jgi:hypothetical protein
LFNASLLKFEEFAFALEARGVSECADLNPLCSASASAVRELEAMGMSKVNGHTSLHFIHAQPFVTKSHAAAPSNYQIICVAADKGDHDL